MRKHLLLVVLAGACAAPPAEPPPGARSWKETGPFVVEACTLTATPTGFFAAGARWEGDGTCGVSGQHDGWLGRLDAEGRLVDEVHLPDATVARRALPEPDGGCFVAGTLGPSGWWARLDPTGRIVAQGEAPRLGVQDVARVGSDLRLLVGHRGDEEVVLGLDGEGHVRFERAERASPETGFAMRALAARLAGGAAVVGWRWRVEGDAYGMVPWLAALDQEGHRLWERTYDEGVGGGAESIAPLGDGWVLGGLEGRPPATRAVVRAVDATGAERWRAVVEGAGDVRCLAVLADGRVAVGVADAVLLLDGATGALLERTDVRGAQIGDASPAGSVPFALEHARVDCLAPAPSRGVQAGLYPSVFRRLELRR